MIKFINVYKDSLSVAYSTEEKAIANKSDNGQMRVIFITPNGVIKDITEQYNKFKE